MRKFLLVLTFAIYSITAGGAVYKMPGHGNDIIGRIINARVQKGDTINRLVQRYDLSYHELLEANPEIHPRKLYIGETLIIPSAYILPKYRQGIVINTAEPRLYYFYPDGRHVFTTPVGLGRYNWRTPTMVTKVIKKEENPIWFVPKSIREHVYKTIGKEIPEEIPPGPDNPLGKYAIYLGRNTYLIHGTNNPNSVGKYYSSGCIRLYNNAIISLFEAVPIGTEVHIIHQPNKTGWMNGQLYLESHEPVSGHEKKPNSESQMDVERYVEKAITNHHTYIDWYKVYIVAQNKLGIPIPVGKELYNEEE
jgi:L,D-transpeptidase ErfK/SrfK